MGNSKQFSAFCALFKQHGFHRRGKAFFRLWGDGVLQVLKYCDKIPNKPYEDINIGLFSMYGEIEPSWLTSQGCIPRYQSHWLEPGVKQQYSDVRRRSVIHMQDVDRIEHYTINVQFIENFLIPFLDSVNTQALLAEAILFFDQEACGPVIKKVRWNDALKIAPYLYSGNLDKALVVIESILHQHAFAQDNNKKYGLSLPQTDDAYYLYLQKIILNTDHIQIHQYLRSNYEKNIKQTSFLRR